MRISTLLVGFGYAANTFHLSFLDHLSAFTVKAVVSSNQVKVHARIPDCEVYASLNDALKSDQFDLVVITTPNHLHASQAERALNAGCHVLVEKPFTLSSKTGQALVELANRQGKKLCVFHNRRFDGDFLTIKQLLATHAVGEVKRVESRFDRFRPVPRPRWREQAGPGAGIFWDLGPHLIDQCVQLWGMPTALNAQLLTQRQGSETDDAFELTLFYPTHIAQLGSTPFEAGSTLRFALQGTRGSYKKYALDPQEGLLKAGIDLGQSNWAQTEPPESGVLYTQNEQTRVVNCQGDYLGFYNQLAHAITTDAALPADAESVVPVLALIEIAIASSRAQRTLPVPSA